MRAWNEIRQGDFEYPCSLGTAQRLSSSRELVTRSQWRSVLRTFTKLPSPPASTWLQLCLAAYVHESASVGGYFVGQLFPECAQPHALCSITCNGRLHRTSLADYCGPPRLRSGAGGLQFSSTSRVVGVAQRQTSTTRSTSSARSPCR